MSKHKVKTKRVVYEKIELLEEDRYEELLSDLRKRLSINQITKVKIGEVNFFRKTSVLMVYFEDERDNNY